MPRTSCVTPPEEWLCAIGLGEQDLKPAPEEAPLKNEGRHILTVDEFEKLFPYLWDDYLGESLGGVVTVNSAKIRAFLKRHGLDARGQTIGKYLQTNRSRLNIKIYRKNNREFVHMSYVFIRKTSNAT